MYNYRGSPWSQRHPHPHSFTPPLPPPVPYDPPPPPPPPPRANQPRPLFTSHEQDHTSSPLVAVPVGRLPQPLFMELSESPQNRPEEHFINNNNNYERPSYHSPANPRYQGFHDNQAPPTYGNFESRYNPDMYQFESPPPPLFQPRDSAQYQSRDRYYHGNHEHMGPPSSGYPQWRERSPTRSHPPPPPSHHTGVYHEQQVTPLITQPSPSFRVDNLKRIVPAETLFDLPGRKERPSHIVIIIRGLPGSGKSHLTKLIKEKEVQHLSVAPRILSIDTYFVNEIEKIEKDPLTGRKIKKKVDEYEYDISLEPSYLSSMLKQFNKTLSEGYFSMILVDAVNSKISDFDQFWSNAKLNGFEAFVVELKESVDVCTKRNIHNRTREEIELLAKQWETTPPHFLQLDVTSLLSPQDSNTIDEVDMEMADSDKEDEIEKEDKREEQSPPIQEPPGLITSRWEQDTMNEDMLDKLDGFRKRKSLQEREEEEENDEEKESLSLKEYLQRKEDEYNKEGKPFKKRVRWADLEAEKEELRKKEIGFSLGTSWSKVSEEEVDRILNSTNESNKNITNNNNNNHKPLT